MHSLFPSLYPVGLNERVVAQFYVFMYLKSVDLRVDDVEMNSQNTGWLITCRD